MHYVLYIMCIYDMLSTSNEINVAHNLQVLNLITFNLFYDHTGHKYDIWIYMKYSLSQKISYLIYISEQLSYESMIKAVI